jgi:hypothetical protein
MKKMSIYKVHFSWKEKDVILRARSLDLTHPYFVSIRDLIFPEGKKIIIDPSEDEVRKTFGQADHLMIPFQTVHLIEELDERVEDSGEKVRNFTLIESEEDDEGEN